tara:strand:+ start:231 stop:704 length:474 start_codon:yes stop_codon:yes gene_type:complete
MKRIKSGDKILMGTIDANSFNASYNRIPLFDGKFTTGYKVVQFSIVPVAVTEALEVQSILATEPRTASGPRIFDSWHWNDVTEVAWAAWNVPNAINGVGFHEYLRDDSIVIEDLYISAYGSDTSLGYNYKIVLEKYEFAAWDGASILVQNLSQAGPE